MKRRRRAVLMGLAAAATPFVATRGWAQGPAPFRFALTPVFLDNDAAVISALRAALAEGMGQDIELVQRRTYQEISGALLDGSVDAAWTCGYPYLQHKTELSLLGVPVWRGQPLYQSYLSSPRMIPRPRYRTCAVLLTPFRTPTATPVSSSLRRISRGMAKPRTSSFLGSSSPTATATWSGRWQAA